MRKSAASALVIALSLGLAGCGGDDAPTASPSPSTTSASPSPEPTTESPEPTTPAETAAPFVYPTTITAEEMLVTADGSEVDADETDWAFDNGCRIALSPEATASLVVSTGDGTNETPVGIQQTAVFADDVAAAAEMDRISGELKNCETNVKDAGVTFVVEPFSVGDQGVQLVVDYAGEYAQDGSENAVGFVAAFFRRGNTVTLVGDLGGEGTIGNGKKTAMTMGNSAWGLLCAHDPSGCAAG